jgi:hypothetical protein
VLWVLPLQQFAYRQLMYLVLIQSALTALTGARLRWHKLARSGTAGAAAAIDRPAAAPPPPPPVVAISRPRGVAKVGETVDVD